MNVTARSIPFARNATAFALAAWGAALPTAAFAQAAGAAPAAASASAPSGDPATLEALNRRINDQVRRLAELRRSLEREEASLQEMRQAIGQRMLAEQRGGASPAQGTAVSAGGPVVVGAGPDPTVVPAGIVTPSGAIVAPGDAPSNAEGRPPAVAPIFEEPGVLTARGSYVLEPSLQYSYASNNRVTLLGYTIIPALVVGLIDVREVQRHTLMGALTGRWGVTNRWELEARVPYAVRSDKTRSRELGTGSTTESIVEADGHGIGDVELAARYQITNGTGPFPYLIGGLRFKSRTGRDPFEVTTDCVTRCVGNATGTGQPLDLPTGSGFYSLQPSLTWLFPSDPAVLFGTFSYLYNFERDNVSRRVRNGESEFIGKVKPGNVLGFNVGLGLALNERSSFSVGYDHAMVGRTKQNGEAVPGTLRTTLSTLLIGYSYRKNSQTAVNVSLGAGLTTDTPGVTLAIRTPFTF